MHQTSDTPRLSKAESSRVNGALSSGPSSEQGKLNSANARLKHGAYSKRILMDGESAEGYESFQNSFFNLFLPVDPFEAECVESMVTARWRIRRLEASEAANLNIALDGNKEKVEAAFDAVSPLQERAIAVQDQMPAIDANTRVQERLHRIYERNFKLLANSRKKSGRQIPYPVSNEPLAEPTHTVSPATEPPVAPVQPSESAILTDDPTEKAAPSHVAASLATKITMFLVIFALLLLKPVSPSSKSFASAGSINSESTVK
jgi:hypothetical protein